MIGVIGFGEGDVTLDACGPDAALGAPELSTRSEAFRGRWAAHDVEYYRSGVQPFHHPIAGDLTLDYDALEIPADPGLTIIAYTAEPGSPARQALDQLASSTSTPDNLRAPQEHTDLVEGTPPPIRSDH